MLSFLLPLRRARAEILTWGSFLAQSRGLFRLPLVSIESWLGCLVLVDQHVVDVLRRNLSLVEIGLLEVFWFYTYWLVGVETGVVLAD
jgi:hypothetical protein